METNPIIFFTDGAYSGARKKGGWAVYCPNYRLRICSGEYNTTNNRMEMMAVLKALEWISDSNIPDRDIVIVSDSLYVINTMKGLYAKKTNIDLWTKLDQMVELLFNKRIKWVHTKGHTNSSSFEAEGNNIVDQLAVMATLIK